MTKYGLTRTEISGGSGSVYGANYRISFDPKTYEWSANFEANTLKLSRKDLYQAAMWVVCMEQAFSIFAQKYGKFGEGLHEIWSASISENLKARDDSITAGSQTSCLGLFFGDNVIEEDILARPHYGDLDGTKTSNDDFDKMMLESRKPLIEGLLNLAKSQDGNADIDYHLDASLSSGKGIFTTYANGLMAELGKMQTADASSCISCIEEMKQQVDIAWRGGAWNSYKAARDKTYDLLDELNKHEEVKNLHIYKALMVAVGTLFEHPDLSRNYYMYSGHAYNVDRVTFKDNNNKDIKIDNDTTLDDLLKVMSIDNSMVVLQNPHGTTTKHLLDDNNNAAAATGSFETSVREVMAATTSVEVGRVKNYRKNAQ